MRAMLDAYRRIPSILNKIRDTLGRDATLVELTAHGYQLVREQTGLPARLVTLGIREFEREIEIDPQTVDSLPLDEKLFSVKGASEIALVSLNGRRTIPYRVDGYGGPWRGISSARLVIADDALTIHVGVSVFAEEIRPRTWDPIDAYDGQSENIDATPTDSLNTVLRSIPRQTVGPHFELDDGDVVTFVPPEALDREGNNVARLRRLHPTLRALANELLAALGKGNVPHYALRDRTDAYRALVDQDLAAIDFALLFQAGIRLANAERAATADDELPRLTVTARETLDSLVALHGTFMLSTREGQECIALEERYTRNPQDEATYRQDAAAFAADLTRRPDLVDPRVAEYIKQASEEIGKGSNPERSGVSATGAIKNATITIGAAAALGGLSAAAVATGSPLAIVGAGVGVLVGGEGLKKSKPFAAVAALVTRGMDQVSEADSVQAVRELARKLEPQRDFLLSIAPRLRRLAERREEFQWLSELLDWLRMQRR